MDVAAFVEQRRADIDAFAKAVFPHGEEKKKVKGSKQLSAPLYRRPSSANTPLSFVVREAKDSAKRKRRRSSGKTDGFGEEGPLSRLYTDYYIPTSTSSSAAAEASRRIGGGGKQKAKKEERDSASSAKAVAAALRERTRELAVRRRHQRPLAPEAWRRYRKRRRRLLARRRPTALRRRRIREVCLRYGKLQPPCACCSSGGGGGKGSARTRGRRGRRRSLAQATQTLWLPSHRYTSKAFQFRPQVIHLRGPSARATHAARPSSPAFQATTTTTTTTVTLAVPWQAHRKRHRCLQRWVANLRYHNPLVFHRRKSRGKGCPSPCTVTPALPSSVLRYHPPQGSPPPHCLLADLSHHCIYHVVPRAPLQGKDGAVADWLFTYLGIQVDPRGRKGSTACSVSHVGPRDGVRRRRAATLAAPPPPNEAPRATVFHGHAWSSEGRQYDEAGRVRLLRSEKRMPDVLPVTVVRVESASEHSFWVVASAPVHLPAKAFRACRIHLSSAWSPCGRGGRPHHRFASLLEYWRVRTPLGTVTELARRALQNARAALKRASASRLQQRKAWIARQRKKRKGSPPPRRSAPSRDRGSGSGGYDLLVFPSLGRNDMSLASLCGQKSVSERSVWSVLIISRKGTNARPALGTRRPTRASAPTAMARRKHFFVSRLTFHGLLRAKALAGSRKGGRCRPPPLGYRAGSKVIGLEDRKTLLRLLGRATYPDDYGGAGCDIAGEEDERRYVAAVAAEWGTRDNANRRLVVRPAGAAGHGRRLPAEHAKVGTHLLRVECLGDDGGEEECWRVERVGLVTSQPLFSQSIGSVVAPVWAVFPFLPRNTIRWECGVLEQGGGKAGAGAPPTATALYLLATPDVADELCTATARTKRCRRGDGDAAHRHRSSGGSCVREKLLRNPSLCTVVEILQLFV